MFNKTLIANLTETKTGFERASSDAESSFVDAINCFNEKNSVLNLRYVEFTISYQDKTITFNEVDY